MAVLNKEQRTIEKSGEFQTQSIGIKDAGKMFKILVDGIYSDPYGSLVRELTCNAIDANTESKTDKNVEVIWIDKNIVTGAEETLVIKDYGLGISPDRMYNIFCFLGESTKGQTNDEIGAWGLGSKSPFKYTDSFTISTVNDGIEYLYISNLNEAGVAEINQITKHETNLPSGTEIRIPIKEKHHKVNFLRAINTQLVLFDNITYKNLNVNKLKILKETENYFMYESNTEMSGIKISLGKVLYNIDYNIHSKYPYKFRVSNIILKFNIGDIDPTASREQIDYTEGAINKIKNKLNIIVDSINKDLIDEFKKEKDLFKSIDKYNVYYNNAIGTREKYIYDEDGDDIVISDIGRLFSVRSYNNTYKLSINLKKIESTYLRSQINNDSVIVYSDSSRTNSTINNELRSKYKRNLILITKSKVDKEDEELQNKIEKLILESELTKLYSDYEKLYKDNKTSIPKIDSIRIKNINGYYTNITNFDIKGVYCSSKESNKLNLFLDLVTYMHAAKLIDAQERDNLKSFTFFTLSMSREEYLTNSIHVNVLLNKYKKELDEFIDSSRKTIYLINNLDLSSYHSSILEPIIKEYTNTDVLKYNNKNRYAYRILTQTDDPDFIKSVELINKFINDAPSLIELHDLEDRTLMTKLYLEHLESTGVIKNLSKDD